MSAAMHAIGVALLVLAALVALAVAFVVVGSWAVYRLGLWLHRQETRVP